MNHVSISRKIMLGLHACMGWNNPKCDPTHLNHFRLEECFETKAAWS